MNLSDCNFCAKSAHFITYNFLNYILFLAAGDYMFKTFALPPVGSCRPNLIQQIDVLYKFILEFLKGKMVQI